MDKRAALKQAVSQIVLTDYAVSCDAAGVWTGEIIGSGAVLVTADSKHGVFVRLVDFVMRNRQRDIAEHMVYLIGADDGENHAV